VPCAGFCRLDDLAAARQPEAEQGRAEQRERCWFRNGRRRCIAITGKPGDDSAGGSAWVIASNKGVDCGVEPIIVRRQYRRIGSPQSRGVGDLEADRVRRLGVVKIQAQTEVSATVDLTGGVGEILRRIERTRRRYGTERVVTVDIEVGRAAIAHQEGDAAVGRQRREADIGSIGLTAVTETVA
jgi:hypothetical protein